MPRPPLTLVRQDPTLVIVRPTAGRVRLGPAKPEDHGRLLAAQLGATFDFHRQARGQPRREPRLRRKLVDCEARILSAEPRARDAALIELLSEWEPAVVAWAEAQLDAIATGMHWWPVYRRPRATAHLDDYEGPGSSGAQAEVVCGSRFGLRGPQGALWFMRGPQPAPVHHKYDRGGHRRTPADTGGHRRTPAASSTCSATSSCLRTRAPRGRAAVS